MLERVSNAAINRALKDERNVFAGALISLRDRAEDLYAIAKVTADEERRDRCNTAAQLIEKALDKLHGVEVRR